RDIKPANFFLTRGADGAPLLKVLDFGISKAPTAGSNLTATQSVMGTPAYMSPEQMRSSRDVDHRSDIWSLGVVLYELLQGAQPFSTDTFSSMVLKVVNDPLPPLTVQLPGDLAAIVYRCLEKDPARRFQNVAELAHALAPYAQSETQASISVQRTRSIIGLEAHRSATEPGGARRAIPPSTLSGAASARNTASTGGRRWPIVAGLGVLAGVVAVAIVASNGGGAGSGKKADGMAPAARPDIAAPPPPVAATPAAPPATVPPVAPPANTVTATPSAPATTPPATTPPATTSPATPQPATPQPAAAAQATPPIGGSPGSATETPPGGTMAKKPKKLAKPGAGPKPNGGGAKPQTSPDEDVLGSRN
ncbi:MAG TPA: serine/threonine-protein kinase, partial [Kofleriaceae bacterium]|nr:serine/threonine-protein kinase [Kofleriaceae bacterium]